MFGKTAIIEVLANQQEAAISEYGDRYWQAYVKYRDAYLSGPEGGGDDQTEEDVLIKRYLMSSSVIAAHFHLLGEKEKRDKAAHSCAMLVSQFGYDPVRVLEQHVMNEQLWVQCMRHEGLTPQRGCGVIALLVAIVALGVSGVVFWWLLKQ